MSIVKMRAPEGYEFVTVTTEFGNTTIGSDGIVSVDSRCVPSLHRAGFSLIGLYHTKAGVHVVTGAESAANVATFDTGFSALTSRVIQITRGSNVITGDASVSDSDGVITVADGSTFTMATGDEIHWIAYGTEQ